MTTKLVGFEPGKEPVPVKDQLDKNIHESAKALVVGACRPHSDKDDLANPDINDTNHNDDSFLRFILLCTARAQFEDEDVIGHDPELQWVQIARDALASATKGLPKGYYPIPRLFSESDADVEIQRQLYQDTIGRLLTANSDETANVDLGLEFAAQVATGEVQLRYI